MKTRQIKQAPSIKEHSDPSLYPVEMLYNRLRNTGWFHHFRAIFSGFVGWHPGRHPLCQPTLDGLTQNFVERRFVERRFVERRPSHAGVAMAQTFETRKGRPPSLLRRTVHCLIGRIVFWSSPRTPYRAHSASLFL